LTGLPNRVLFQRMLMSACGDTARNETARNGRTRFAVLFLDLDHFKQINDTYGHLTGDRTLIAAARRFVHCLRPDDVVARRDGDEFTVLLRNVDSASEAAIVANRLLETLRAPLSIQDHTLQTSASIGIALHQPNTSPADLLHSADQAMYRAKARGGNDFEIADDPARDRLAR
jgi:diguanylate cyclase (GGDEF)-like protein